MQQVNANTLAEFILISYPDKNITPMKLQKLAYYAKVWSLIAGRPCTDALFERWEYGPVNRPIYNTYREFAKQPIPPPVNPPQQRIAGEDAELLKFILDHYVHHSAVALSAMTHKETPWKDTPANQVISDQVIYDYYSKMSFAKNFQGKSWKEGTYYVLKTNSWYSFTMDMSEEEAETYASYPSYANYLERRKKANLSVQRFMQKFF
ncbi:MAG: DUF4065 domain-containing protein [Candidatus Electrothrix sp. AUS4]|nr:DUF4065 domain-containing protein [Candidatus Electrothrix sp. AUS4]